MAADHAGGHAGRGRAGRATDGGHSQQLVVLVPVMLLQVLLANQRAPDRAGRRRACRVLLGDHLVLVVVVVVGVAVAVAET